MLFTEGSMLNAAPAFLCGKSGPINQASGGLAAEAPIFGLRVLPYVHPQNGSSVNRPMAISQIRVRLFTTTLIAGAGQAVIFELHKTTCTANFTDGLPVTAQRKKVSGYTAIPATEIDARIADTVALSAGGSHILQEPGDHPFEMIGAFGTSPFAEGYWTAEDGFPLVIEQNEGLLLHSLVAIPAAAGVIRAFIGLDFFRF